MLKIITHGGNESTVFLKHNIVYLVIVRCYCDLDQVSKIRRIIAVYQANLRKFQDRIILTFIF